MGWEEDSGLGKNSDGITKNISLARREEGLGLGMERSTDDAGNKGWNTTVTSFNGVLDILKQSYGGEEKQKKKKKKAGQKISAGIK